MFSVALLLLLAAGFCVKCEQLTQPASVTVQPGQRLSITCQVSYSVSSYYTAWIRQPAGEGLEWMSLDEDVKDSLKTKFSVELDSNNNRVTLIGQNMQPGDSAVYYCARGDIRSGGSYYFDYWGQGTTVTVTSDTVARPTVFPLLPCGAGTGDTVTLGCMATGFTPSSLMFSWTKGSTPLPNFVQYPPTQQDNRYMKVTEVRVPRRDWESTAKFYCKAEHGGQNSNTLVKKPEILYQKPSLKVMGSNDESGASFTCFAKDFSPKNHQFKWLKNEEIIPENMYNTRSPVWEGSSENGTLYSAASFLTIADHVDADTRFTCEFQGKSANGDYYINSSLTYMPNCDCPSGEVCSEAAVEIEIIDPKNEDMFLKSKGTVTCKVTVNTPAVDRITWEDQDGKEMAGASKIPTNGERGPFLVPLDITLEEWNGTLKRYCVVEHSGLIDPKKEAYERFERPTQRPTVFMLPPIEHTRENEVTLTCYVKDFFPHEILVTWLVDDKPANSSYSFKTTKPVQNDRNYSAYGYLSLTTEQWQKKDMVYSCVVHHVSLMDIKSIVRSVVYTDSEKTNLVNLSLNVPNTCRAQ